MTAESPLAKATSAQEALSTSAVSGGKGSPTGRQRKYYRLTRRGKTLLDEKRAEWTAFHKGVEDVLSGGANALSFS